MALPTSRRPLLISKAWPQTALLIFLVGFFILGLLGYRTYVAGPPIPNTVASPTGDLLFAGAEISHGQIIFYRNGLVEYVEESYQALLAVCVPAPLSSCGQF